MLQIIRPQVTKTECAYRRLFRSVYECHGFLCDEQGNPVFRGPREKTLFEQCAKKTHFKDCGRVKREYTRVSPAIGKCECGNNITLEKQWGRPNVRCRCGRLYAISGEEITKENG